LCSSATEPCNGARTDGAGEIGSMNCYEPRSSSPELVTNEGGRRTSAIFSCGAGRTRCTLHRRGPWTSLGHRDARGRATSRTSAPRVQRRQILTSLGAAASRAPESTARPAHRSSEAHRSRSHAGVQTGAGRAVSDLTGRSGTTVLSRPGRKSKSKASGVLCSLNTAVMHGGG